MNTSTQTGKAGVIADYYEAMMAILTNAKPYSGPRMIDYESLISPRRSAQIVLNAPKAYERIELTLVDQERDLQRRVNRGDRKAALELHRVQRELNVQARRAVAGVTEEEIEARAERDRIKSHLATNPKWGSF